MCRASIARESIRRARAAKGRKLHEFTMLPSRLRVFADQFIIHHVSVTNHVCYGHWEQYMNACKFRIQRCRHTICRENVLLRTSSNDFH